MRTHTGEKPFKLVKAGYQPKYDDKGGRGSKAGYQREKAGAIGDKSGLHVKTEMEESSHQYGRKRWSSKGGRRGPARDVKVKAVDAGKEEKEDEEKGGGEEAAKQEVEGKNEEDATALKEEPSL